MNNEQPQIPLVLVIAIILVMGGAVSPMVYAQQPQKSIIKHAEDFTGETIQVFNELFKDCPAGIILYKLNGELVVVCLIDSIHGKLVDNQGQIINIDVHLDNDDHKSNHHGNNNNHEGPDQDCLFNASLPKCDPDSDGNCPDGFNLNEDGNCFPDHHETGCPEGTHGVDDDETGQCYKDDEDCPDGMELKDGNCTYIPEEEPVTPLLTTSEEEGVGAGEEPLDSICGGVPCTASDKEDSTTTTSDPVLGDDNNSGAETTTTEDDISSNDDDTNRLSEDNEETVEDNNEGEDNNNNEEDNN